MPRFAYRLKDEKGRDYQGTIEAKDKKGAQAKLNTAGYYLTSLHKEIKPLLFSRKISRPELVTFFHQNATLIEAGIPILKALAGLAAQTENNAFRAIINDIRSRLESGFKLSQAMLHYPRVFSEFVISMVQIGETAGNLSEILKDIAGYLEREEDLRRRLKSAFAYPAVVSIVTIAVASYLVIFVVPVFVSVYSSMKIALPGPTLTLMAISGFIREWWLGLLIICVAMILGFRRFRETKKMRFLIDKLKLSIPLFGTLNKKVATSRFIRSFGFMVSSGIPIVRALDVAEPIAANKVVSKVIDGAKLAVNRGEGISNSLRVGKIFPPVAVQMVATGEESGSLDRMLAKSADFLDNEIDVAIKTLTVKIEPVITLVLATVVGFIALAIYLPMFDIIRQISK